MLLFLFQKSAEKFPDGAILSMKKALFIKFTILICILAAASGVFAQSNLPVSDDDKTPSLIKDLPESETVRNRATLAQNTDDLRKALGERSVFDLINLGGGIEAVTAGYPQGKLLIVEYPTPQTSIDADGQFKQRLGESPQNPPIYYRRIGNYNAFVFDASDEPAANSLLDQVKYNKTIQWLGEDPLPAIYRERDLAIQTGDLFLSTLILVVLGFGSTILAGVLVGLIFFYIREQKRHTTQIYTDAGGMTRLNLDGLTSEHRHERLLKD
jgi:hypothetical protein